MSIVLIDISEEKHIKDNMFKSFKGRKKQNKVEKNKPQHTENKKEQSFFFKETAVLHNDYGCQKFQMLTIVLH